MQREIIKKIVYGLLRHLLGAASGWAVSRGILTEGQVEFLLLGIAGLIVVAALSVWNKIRQKLHLEVALELPPGSTLADVHQELKARKE